MLESCQSNHASPEPRVPRTQVNPSKRDKRLWGQEWAGKKRGPGLIRELWEFTEGCHVTSRRPYWYTKPVLWKLNSIFMQKSSFVWVNQYGGWWRELKRSMERYYKADFQKLLICYRFPSQPYEENIPLICVPFLFYSK